MNSAAPVKNPKVRSRKPRLVRTPEPPRTYDWWLWSGLPTFEGVCDALAFQYAVLDELIQPLLADGWPTVLRTDRWRVAARLARLAAVAEEVVAATQDSPAEPSGEDAVAWYRRRSAITACHGGAAAMAGIDAEQLVRAGAPNLAARHRAATATAIAVLRSGEPDLVLGGPAAGLTLAEFAATRLVAAVVHGLDLAEALGRPGRSDPTATNLVSGFLAAVADGGHAHRSPAPIAVDGHGALITLTDGRHRTRIPAVDWIRTATGRRPADEVLPPTHAWLVAELPLAA